MLCQDPHYPLDVCHAARHSRKMGRKWELHSMAILLTFNPDARCKDIESMGIGLIVHQHKAPLGQISSIPHLIRYAHSLMEVEVQSTAPIHRTYCMIVGNYGMHMAFAMDPPFCMAYSLDFIHEDDPAKMTFRN